MTKPISATAPSLLNAAAAPSQGAPSLLSSLDGTASNQTGKKRGAPVFWIIAILLLLTGLLVGAAVMVAHNATSSFTHANPPVLPLTAAPSSKLDAVAEVKTTAVPVEVASAQVATIINDLPTSPENKSINPAPAPDSNPHDRLSAALTGTQSQQVKTELDKTDPAVTAKPDAQPQPVIAAAQHKQTDAEVHNTPKLTAKKTKPAKADPDDRDVRLLAALVASTKDIAPKKSSRLKTHSKVTSDGKNSNVKDDDRNQDIVERKPGDSTASLLNRCKKLGVIEGEFCRWRICSNRWDSDPDCKSDVRPKAPVAENSVQ